MIHKNYFERLGFDRVKFDLTDEEVNSKYFCQQKLHHPDHAESSIRISTELNEAYCNLIDPLARAQHIFELNQMDIYAGPINLKIFELLADPKRNYEISFDQMRKSFINGDLGEAYKNWCACQYLKRMIKA